MLHPTTNVEQQQLQLFIYVVDIVVARVPAIALIAMGINTFPPQ